MQRNATRGLSLTYCVDLLSRYLHRQRIQVFLLAVLLLSSIGLRIINPQILRHFIDTATSDGTAQALTQIAVLFLSVAVINQLLSVATAYVSENVGWIATNQLRADLALHCLNLDMSFHTTHTPGELIERIDGDVNDLANFFSQFVIQVVGNLLLILGVLVALFLENYWVGIGLALYVVVTLIVLSRLWPLSVTHMAALREIEAQLSSFFEERLAGTEDIGANDGWRYSIRCMLQISRERVRRGRKASTVGGLVIGATNVLFALSSSIGLAFGSRLYLREAISIGTVYLIFRYATLLFTPLRQITLQIDDLQRAGAGIQRIQALLQTQTSIRESAASSRTGLLAIEAPTIRFQNVSLTYTADEPVLQDLSFEIQSGQVLGLLGRTGSGKTSVARLLLRLYDPTGGTVQLNGVDIRQVPLVDLRQQVGLVPQDVQLFRATVRENLTFYTSHITDQQIVQVLDEVGLSAWYQALPDGIDTRLDPDKLSAGEAQLLAFGRVLLRNPGLVILDEASSRLDPVTEQRLDMVLDRLMKARTGVIVAHRLSTVQRVDHIMILGDGRILEYGERQSLASDPESCFSRLLQTGLDLPQATEVVLS
jgi:ATP-binding cassette subfamily B protein